MKWTAFFIVSLLMAHLLSFGQSRIKFDFPTLPETKLQMYYFYGNKIDSSIVALDKAGQADFVFPDKNFRGLVQLANNGMSLSEFIAGEAQLQIVSPAVAVNGQTVFFPGSEENAFFTENLHLETRLMERLSWLQAGYRFYGHDSSVIAFVQQESTNIQDSLQVMHTTLEHSPLYAARFIQWVSFLNRMYEARQQKDPGKIQAVAQEMERKADINALYTSGQLWNSVAELYLTVFGQLDSPEKQIAYALSINKIADRLSGDVQESFYAAAIVQCERYAWAKAQEIIVQQVALTLGDKTIQSPRLQRLVGLSKVRKGGQASEIVGLAPAADQNRMVIFYESGCGHCKEQLALLKENYAAIKKKGIRIITISADTSQEVFDYHSKDFPWPDKICDYQGFAGANFINYGVLGTPSIYMIDKKGIIQGRYGTIAETGVLK